MRRSEVRGAELWLASAPSLRRAVSSRNGASRYNAANCLFVRRIDALTHDLQTRRFVARCAVADLLPFIVPALLDGASETDLPGKERLRRHGIQAERLRPVPPRRCRTTASRAASRIGAPDSHFAAATSRISVSRSSMACTRDCAALRVGKFGRGRPGGARHGRVCSCSCIGLHCLSGSTTGDHATRCDKHQHRAEPTAAKSVRVAIQIEGHDFFGPGAGPARRRAARASARAGRVRRAGRRRQRADPRPARNEWR